MATDVVYKFLKEHNRPFSANDVLSSVGKDHGKSAVQKALDKLTDKGKIFEKIYGKQKVYCVTQEEVDGSSMSTTLREMDNQITELTSKLSSVKEQLQSSSNELKGLQNKMTTEEAKIERDKLVNEVSMLKSKLGGLKSSCEPVVSEEDKVKIKGEHEKCVKEYRKRKRICGDITNSILEGYPKTKKHLFEDIGIETDEDVNFTLKV